MKHINSSKGKEMKQIAIRTPLVTLAATMLLTFGATLAYADSPREWGYWDAATAAGPGDAGGDGFSNLASSQNINTAKNNNSGNSLNNEQNATRLKDNPTVNPTEITREYIAYNICNHNCDNRRRDRKTVKTAGKMHVNVTSGANPPKAKLSMFGTFNGMDFVTVDNDAGIKSFTSGLYSEEVVHSTFFYAKIEATYDNESQSPFYGGGIVLNRSSGNVLIGKPISATDIAKQFRLGQQYHFAGSSYLGANVKLAVNFQKATWNGNWSKVKNIHNGFKASGNITGNSLTSNKVKGFGKKRAIGFVKKGNVDATLVGVIKGTDASKAGVIGKTVLTVKKRRGTKKVADIFSATAVK